MEFWKLSVENLITLLVLGAGGLGFVYTIRGRLDALSERLLVFEKEIRRLVDVLVVQNRQEERMNSMENRISAQGLRLDDLTKRFNEKMDKA